MGLIYPTHSETQVWKQFQWFLYVIVTGSNPGVTYLGEMSPEIYTVDDDWRFYILSGSHPHYRSH